MDLNLLPLRAVWHGSNIEHAQNDYLMIVMHGRGDSPEGYDFLPPALNLSQGASKPHLNYLMLQAPDDYYEGYSWYALAPNQLPGIIRSRGLLEKVFEQLIRAGFKHERIFLFGFSQGCLMTLEFGGRYPHKLAGYIGISGFVYDEKKLAEEASPYAKQGNWFITHGTHDDVLPVEKTRLQIEYLQSKGFKIEYKEYRKVHTIDEAIELPEIRERILKQMS